MLDEDLFHFWSRIAPQETIHPDDRPIFSRVRKHGFNLECLPGPCKGPLKSAPVVLLYLSPGFTPYDLEEAVTPEGQGRYVQQRTGTAPLTGKDQHPPAYRWWSTRVRCFGPIPDVERKIAILNLGAYHSTSFADWGMLCTLPSSRASIDWAQRVLLPEAEAGKRVVICLRSPRYWGLDAQDHPYGESLFAPRTTRGGHMLRGDGRENVCRAVHRILSP